MKKSQDDDSDFIPDTVHTPKNHARVKSQGQNHVHALLLDALSVSTADARTIHLRRKHRLRIPRGCWAKTWISKPENHHHYLAAVAEQARANSILSPEMEN